MLGKGPSVRFLSFHNKSTNVAAEGHTHSSFSFWDWRFSPSSWIPCLGLTPFTQRSGRAVSSLGGSTSEESVVSSFRLMLPEPGPSPLLAAARRLSLRFL